MKIVSWNVNGLRSILGKGLLEFWDTEKPDVLCLQETKAKPEQVSEVSWPRGFEAHWNSADKPGYSGTATFAKKKPKKIERGIGDEEHDREGRVVTLEYEEFFLVNVYTPNSQRELTRLDYRTKKWEPAFRKYLKKLERKSRLYSAAISMSRIPRMTWPIRKPTARTPASPTRSARNSRR